MVDLVSFAPLAAGAFAVPQFAPQIRRLSATGDTTGVSWAWAALTCVNNAAWTAYFALARYWTALIPSVSVTFLAGVLAIMLTRRVRTGSRPPILLAAWIALLVSAWFIRGGAGLGTLLTAGFIVQVTPTLWAAYRVARPTGVSAGTWLLIFAELACWLIFGVRESDPRLIILGAAGVIVSTLMVARIHVAARRRQPEQMSRLAYIIDRLSVMSDRIKHRFDRLRRRVWRWPRDVRDDIRRCLSLHVCGGACIRAGGPGLAGCRGCDGADWGRAGRVPACSVGCGVGAPGGGVEDRVGI